ncbi:13158_t:CDS:1 [Ambispora gerdemannii]|uniref:13158_t:CDS:1 n=1 Tax=Ambispora gerdemannii TaxID=144530 RepID=A0A9N9G3L7_9GLOM|nr:13158_t:CDS:1 [Ambispora gerdemannii]
MSYCRNDDIFNIDNFKINSTNREDNNNELIDGAVKLFFDEIYRGEYIKDIQSKLKLYLLFNGIESHKFPAKLVEAESRWHTDCLRAYWHFFDKCYDSATRLVAMSICYGKAKEGVACCQCCVAYIYENEFSFGDGEKEKAFLWYKQAAENGFSPAQEKLASYYARGRIVNQSWELAVAWLQKAAYLGNGKARLTLGEYYIAGAGVPMDTEEGFRWYCKSAETGYAPVYLRLAKVFQEGKIKKKNSYSYFYWIKKAAMTNLNATSMAPLAGLYKRGSGTRRDLHRAINVLTSLYNKGKDLEDEDIAHEHLSDIFL